MYLNNKAMVDLKELERRLDEALAKETKETLTEWLMSKRAGKAQESIDINYHGFNPGKISTIGGKISDLFIMESEKQPNYDNQKNITGNNNSYFLAA